LAARASRDLGAPAREVRLIGLDSDLREMRPKSIATTAVISAIEKLIARDNAARGEFPIEPTETVLGVEPLQFGVVRQLANAALKEIVTLAKGVCSRLEDVEFYPAVPHLDQRAVLRRRQKEKAADGVLRNNGRWRRSRDKSAVVQFEHGHGAERIFLAELLAAINRFDDVDFLVGNLDTLLREEHSDAARGFGALWLS
jgi:hypothetical protein